jgi:ankyrin repeat protein
MLKQKYSQIEILTSSALYSPSQWIPFSVYDWLPKFPRWAPNPFMLSPWTFFIVDICWHNQYQTIFPHSLRYRMQRAIATNDLPEVVALLERGFPVDEPIDRKYGYNPLQIAAINNHYPLIEMLLLRGADINKQDKLGNTPLHHAIINQNHEAIHSLVKNGSDPNLKNKYGLSPLDKASNSPSIHTFIKNYS